jgi:hypothetical protein
MFGSNSEVAKLPWIAINLDHRKDRYEALQASFPGQHIERFSALQHSDPEIGCRTSHLAVIRLAKERNYPWVLILEDDCEPYPEFQTEFPKVCEYLWKHKTDWDIYNGGPNAEIIRKYDGAMLHIEGWISAQFIIVNSSVYDALLSHNVSSTKKIDDYYATFKTLTSSPMLTRQRDTFSDLAMCVTNNIPLFEQSRSKLRMFS